MAAAQCAACHKAADVREAVVCESTLVPEIGLKPANKYPAAPSERAHLISMCSICIAGLCPNLSCWACRRPIVACGFRLNDEFAICGLCVPLRDIWKAHPELASFDSFRVGVAELCIDPEYQRTARRLATLTGRALGRLGEPKRACGTCPSEFMAGALCTNCGKLF